MTLNKELLEKQIQIMKDQDLYILTYLDEVCNARYCRPFMVEIVKDGENYIPKIK